MKASRINLIKDGVAIVILGGFISIALFIVIPGLLKVQYGVLAQNYRDEQKRILKVTVHNVGSRMAALNARLLAQGLKPEHVSSILLEQLSAERFGLNSYGYFYVFDTGYTIIEHPIQAELVGKNLESINTSSGINMGELVSQILRNSPGDFFEYDWTPPGKKNAERKTGYLLLLPEMGWVIASGFYPSDLNEGLNHFAAISGETIRQTQILIGTLMLLFLFVYSVIAWGVYRSIRKIEGNLLRQIVFLEQYKLILDKSSIVSKTDPAGLITYVNDTFVEVTGYSREAALGQKHNIERHPDTPREVFQDMWETIASGRIWHGVLKNRKANGESYFKMATIIPLLDEQGTISEYLSSGHDITELVEKRRDLELAFSTDQLTGLGSRMRLLSDLDAAPDPFVILIDIEGFSSINHAFGTAVGDGLLKQFAAFLFEQAHAAGMTTYRVHADIFAVMANLSSTCRPQLLVDVLEASLKKTNFGIGDLGTRLLFHIGHASEGKNSLICADIALSHAKSLKLMSCGYDPLEKDQSRQAIDNLTILQDLGSALEQGRVRAYSQPILDINTNSVSKFECLMRIENANGVILQPAAFLEISKRANLYQRLTMNMISQACALYRDRSSDFSVNLSIEDLLTAATIDYLCSEAQMNGVCSRLIVEIVETEELRDFERVGTVLRRLRTLGMRIAVDDFGVGYSNFEYLLILDPQFIKIDGSIVQKLLFDERAQDLVRSIVQFARQAKMQTIAEYVDSEELLADVRRLGVDFAQGYLIGKPAAT